MKLPAFVRFPVTLSVVALVTACGLVGGRPTASPPASATATASVVPGAPTASVTPPAITPTVAPASAETAVPPSATLAAGGAAVAGHLGSYCYLGTCADEFESPAKAELPELETGRATNLTFAIGEPVRFVAWSARYGAEPGAEVTELGSGGDGFDPDTSPATPWPLLDSVSFSTPPAGDWSVRVQVFFEGGDLSYSWHVMVP